MAGGKKESGPARWLKSAKSVFRGGHSTSSFSRSGGQASGSASPITSAASATTHGSNSLTLTGAHRIHGASVLTASPVIPEQLLRSGQKVSTAPENATTAPDSLVSQSSAQSTVGLLGDRVSPFITISVISVSENHMHLTNDLSGARST